MRRRQVIGGRCRGWRPAGGRAPRVTGRGLIEGISHDVVTDGRLLHDTVVDTLEPVVEPAQGIAVSEISRVSRILQVALEYAVAKSAHHQFLISARFRAAVGLQHGETVERALLENVVPAADVVHGNIDVANLS